MAPKRVFSLGYSAPFSPEGYRRRQKSPREPQCSTRFGATFFAPSIRRASSDRVRAKQTQTIQKFTKKQTITALRCYLGKCVGKLRRRFFFQKQKVMQTVESA